jgi:hypothetical protein
MDCYNIEMLEKNLLYRGLELSAINDGKQFKCKNGVVINVFDTGRVVFQGSASKNIDFVEATKVMIKE